jgi:molybdate transport system regulatory protein
MLKTQETQNTLNWVEGEIRLAGTIDRRLMLLLQAIEQSGSINQAAKQVGLSYKGAWLIIEKANNLSPKQLISSATGGYMGGGTRLTDAGKGLVDLFQQLDLQYQAFLKQLNQNLNQNSYAQLLLEPLSIANSASNQLFGTIILIQPAEDAVEIVAQLIGGERIAASLSVTEIDGLDLNIGKPILLLIPGHLISIARDSIPSHFAARNVVHAAVTRVKELGPETEVKVRLIGGDSLTVHLSTEQSDALALKPGQAIHLVLQIHDILVAAKA